MCRQRAGCNDGTLTARKGQAATLEAWWKLPRRVLGVLGVWRLANGRLECRNKRGLCAGKGMLERWRPGAWWKLPRGMWRVLGVVLGVVRVEAWQTAGSNALTREGYVQAKGRLQCWNADGQERAGCNPGAAKADGQAWWKLPRRVLGVLGVWRLANGRLECRNKRGLCAGKGQAAMMERWRPGKGRLQPWRLGGSCRGGF